MAAPTSILPPLNQPSALSGSTLQTSLIMLQNLYWPPADTFKWPLKLECITQLTTESSFPDSGYASAEEDDDFQDLDSLCREEEEEELEIIRADPFERAFAIKWLTGFVARSDSWLCALSESDPEMDNRIFIVDLATSILSQFSSNGEDEANEASSSLTRSFKFLSPILERKEVVVELNDAPLSSTDHTSVGLQSWASSIVLAERICLDPDRFGLSSSASLEGKPLRILELGAGTGLLSIAVAKLLQNAEVIATDFHPDVLSNLQQNVEANDCASSVCVQHLDWKDPAPFLCQSGDHGQEKFDVILAADVIYHPQHSLWIKRCVQRLLAANGIFWIIVPVRSTGRHEGLDMTVDETFSSSIPCQSRDGIKPVEEVKHQGLREEKAKLRIVFKEEIARKAGVGRADENSYRLFKIIWEQE